MGELGEGETARIMANGEGYSRELRIDRRHAAILSLIDGKRTLGAILDAAAAKTSIGKDGLLEAWSAIYALSKVSDDIVLNRPE